MSQSPSDSKPRIQLRPYQEEALASIPDAGAYLICLFTGAGKTVIMSQIPRRGRMLILSHRDELVHQPEKYFDCTFGVEEGPETSHGEEVVSASVQSLVRRLDKFQPDDFDVIVVDECFPAGTLVDSVPIEQIREGDYVTAYNHKTECLERRKVLRTFKRSAPDKMIIINGKLVCTLNHPVYEVRTGRYINAANLKLGDSVLLRMRNGSEMGQFDETSASYIPQNRSCVLLGEMQRQILPEKFIGNDEPNEQKICFCQNEDAQSYERYEEPCQDDSDTSANRTQAQSAGREWARNDNSSDFVNGVSCSAESSERICSEDTCGSRQARGVSQSLQSRYSNSRRNDCDRSRRNESYSINEKGAGCEEEELFAVQRVDSIEILECGGSCGCNSLCPNGYVYNLEVEGLNNYFANGILVHNCHHATAPTYRKIFDYFKPRLLLGFTATPNRNDGVGLKAIYSDIIYERNLRWGIENGYLSDIYCLRVDIGVDLRRVAQRLGDYAPDSLERAVNIESANKAIAEAYRLYAKPPVLIFCASVAHAEALAKCIPEAVAVRGGEDRSETLRAFEAGEIPCITNCMVFTEGTDIPRVQTVIMARPTKNVNLYMQAIGRGTRLYPGKEYLTLIDCVGAGDEADICTAPSLLGLDISSIPASQRKTLTGDLFDLPEKAADLEDTPEAWIRNVERVDLWARRNSYDLHGMNYFRMPDGSMVLNTPRLKLRLPVEDSLGRIEWQGRAEPAQKVFDAVYELLKTNYDDYRPLWDLSLMREWGASPASETQRNMVERYFPDYDTRGMTKFEAGQILTRRFGESYGPPTEKQKYFLTRRGYDVSGLTKYEAHKLIGRLKAK